MTKIIKNTIAICLFLMVCLCLTNTTVNAQPTVVNEKCFTEKEIIALANKMKANKEQIKLLDSLVLTYDSSIVNLRKRITNDSIRIAFLDTNLIALASDYKETIQSYVDFKMEVDKERRKMLKTVRRQRFLGFIVGAAIPTTILILKR